jgi:hypothetical protein
MDHAFLFLCVSGDLLEAQSVFFADHSRVTTTTPKNRNTQDPDINNPVFPLFVVFTEQPETRLYFVQFSVPLRHGCTTAT